MYTQLFMTLRIAKSTVEDLERKVYLINAVLTELRKRGMVSTTNPGKMVQRDIGAFVKHMETEKPKEVAGMNGRKKGQRVKTASSNYLVGLLHLLKKVCAFAGNNVFTQMEVQGDPIPRKLPKDLSSLNEKELARITAAANEMGGWRGEVARFIVAIYPYTGVRYNELRLAHFEDIDTEE